jgi:hypothetical protein
MTHDDSTTEPSSVREAGSERYERPLIVEYGSLEQLTQSGSAPLSDSFGGAAGGGS